MTTTADITIAGETRTVEISYSQYGADAGDLAGERTNALVGGVVGTIGRGSARYPTHVSLSPIDAHRPMQRGARETVAADGTRWQYDTWCCIRNRQARIVGWADVAGATNAQHQVRTA